MLLHLGRSTFQTWPISWPFGWWIFYHPSTTISPGKTFVASYHSIALFMVDIFGWDIFPWLNKSRPFTAMICHIMYINLTHPYSLHVLLVRSKFHSDCFFSGTVAMWNWLLRVYFHNCYNLNLFKSSINHYLSYLSP